MNWRLLCRKMQWFKITTLSIVALILTEVITSGEAAYIKNGKSNQKEQGVRKSPKDDKPILIEEIIDKPLSSSKPRLALVVSMKKKQKDAKHVENKKDLREKLMKALLENGEVKDVNSFGLTSEEASEKKRLDCKHDELWDLVEAMTNRRKHLKEELRNAYDDHQDNESESEQNDQNNVNDYIDQKENIEDDSHGSDRSESRNNKIRRRSEIAESDEDISNIEKLPAPLEKFLSAQSIKKIGLRKSLGKFDDFGSEEEEISREERPARRKKNRKKLGKKNPDFYNVNVKFSKLLKDNLEDLRNLEYSARNKKKTKRHTDEVKLKELDNIDSTDYRNDSASHDNVLGQTNVTIPLAQNNNATEDHETASSRIDHSKIQDQATKQQHPRAKTESSDSHPKSMTKPNTRKNKNNNSKNKIKSGKGKEKTQVVEKGSGHHKTNKHYYVDLRSIEDYSSYKGQNPEYQRNLRKSEMTTHKAHKNNIGSKSSKNQPSKLNHLENHLRTISSNNLTEGQVFHILSKEMSNLDAKIANLESKVNRPKHKRKDRRRTNEHQVKSENHISAEPSKILGNDIQKLVSHNITKEESTDRSFNHKTASRQVRSVSSNKTKKRHAYNHAYESDEYIDVSSPEIDTPVQSSHHKYTRSVPFNWFDFNRYLRSSDDGDFRISDLLKKYFQIQRSSEDSAESSDQRVIPIANNQEVLDETVQESPTENQPQPKSANYENPKVTPVEVPKSETDVNVEKNAEEYNKAAEDSKVETIVAEKVPVIEPEDPESSEKSEERSAYMKKKGGIRIPLRLVQDEDGNYSIQLDMKYVCRKCTKQRLKKKRH